MIKFAIVHSALQNHVEFNKAIIEKIDSDLSKIDDFEISVYKSEASGQDVRSDGKNYDGDGVIIFFATGGTEEVAEKIILEAGQIPILLISTPWQNSLPAQLETYSQHKDKRNIIIKYISDIDELNEIVLQFQRVVKTTDMISKSSFGFIGGPSPWLLSSKGKNDLGSFGPKLIPIEIEELVKAEKAVNNIEAEGVTKEWVNKFSNIDVSQKSLIDSARVYLALKNIAAKYQLKSLTVKCFDLLKYNYTACMAMSMLNDEGLVAGCEGDLHASLSLLIGFHLTGCAAWMANPARIDKSKNSIVFAHCTVPISFIDKEENARITTHMESGLSSAIEAPLKLGNVTIFRTGGNFNQMNAITGKVVLSNMGDYNLCRTQAEVVINGDLDEWMENSLGNHHVMVYGDITGDLSVFCDYLNIKYINLSANK